MTFTDSFYNHISLPLHRRTLRHIIVRQLVFLSCSTFITVSFSRCNGQFKCYACQCHLRLTDVYCYQRSCVLLYAAKDLPLFPISSSLLAAAKQRVTLAQELDRLELATRRSSTETGWFRKALIEMDMLVDDEDMYPYSSIYRLNIAVNTELLCPDIEFESVCYFLCDVFQGCHIYWHVSPLLFVTPEILQPYYMNFFSLQVSGAVREMLHI